MDAKYTTCVRCGRKPPEVVSFSYWEEGTVCTPCREKQEADYQKMLADRPWEKLDA